MATQTKGGGKGRRRRRTGRPRRQDASSMPLVQAPVVYTPGMLGELNAALGVGYRAAGRQLDTIGANYSGSIAGERKAYDALNRKVQRGIVASNRRLNRSANREVDRAVRGSLVTGERGATARAFASHIKTIGAGSAKASRAVGAGGAEALGDLQTASGQMERDSMSILDVLRAERGTQNIIETNEAAARQAALDMEAQRLQLDWARFEQEKAMLEATASKEEKDKLLMPMQQALDAAAQVYGVAHDEYYKLRFAFNDAQSKEEKQAIRQQMTAVQEELVQTLAGQVASEVLSPQTINRIVSNVFKTGTKPGGDYRIDDVPADVWANEGSGQWEAYAERRQKYFASYWATITGQKAQEQTYQAGQALGTQPSPLGTPNLSPAQAAEPAYAPFNNSVSIDGATHPSTAGGSLTKGMLDSLFGWGPYGN